MQHSYAAMRIWQGAMATYRGKCLQRLLAEWSTALSNTTTSSRAALPAWDACVSKTEYKEALAVKMLHNKLPTVLRAHGNLHKLLQDMSSSAAAMGVTPRLQNNDATSVAVEIALNVLASAAETVTVVEGVELLVAHRHNEDGPARAKTFLQKYPIQKRGNIPGPFFWMQFEPLAADARPLKKAMKVEPALAVASPAKEVSSASTTVAPSVGMPSEKRAVSSSHSSSASMKLKRRRL